MRTVISNVDGFKSIVEIRDVIKPTGHKQIRFLTEWDNAKRDGSEQVQYELVLSLTQLKNLKDLL